ncbi:MAG: hypothetical protein K0Q70_2357, partial [Rhodospirillales bacterium]|nr:hypothetical protein [Rhodospirillales bacterium]
MGTVADEFAVRHLDTPGVEQAVQIGRPGAAGATRIDAHAFVIRVDQDHGLAAAHHILIDGVKRLFFQSLRMGDEQHADIVRDDLLVVVERADLEELRDLLQDRPRLILQLRIGFEGQRGQQADLLLVR